MLTCRGASLYAMATGITLDRALKSLMPCNCLHRTTWGFDQGSILVSWKYYIFYDSKYCLYSRHLNPNQVPLMMLKLLWMQRLPYRLHVPTRVSPTRLSMSIHICDHNCLVTHVQADNVHMLMLLQIKQCTPCSCGAGTSLLLHQCRNARPFCTMTPLQHQPARPVGSRVGSSAGC